MKYSALCFLLICNLAYGQLPNPRARFIADDFYDDLGHNSLTAGDINGDGVKDLIIGAPGYDAGGVENTGRIYVFHGRNFTGNITMNSTNLIIDGVSAQGYLGGGGILCCDVDGDSIFDILTEAAEVDCTFIDDLGNPNSIRLNRFYIFLGQSIHNQTYLTTAQADGYIQGYFDSENWKKSIHTIGRFPLSGDFNSDGYDDVVFNARQYLQGFGNNPGESQGYLFYGRPDFAQHFNVVTQRDVLLKNGVDLANRFTIPLELNAGTGDVNGDGKDDLVVDALIYGEDYSIQPTASVFFGPITQDTTRMEEADVQITAEPDHHMMWDTSTYDCIHLSDVNGDEREDIILGRDFNDQQSWTSREGIVYVFYGSENLPGFLSSDDANVTVEGTVPGYFNGRFGESIAAGDLNHDGQNDLAIWSAGCGEFGKIHLFKGFSYQDTTIYDFDADSIFSDCQSLDDALATEMIVADVTGDHREELLIRGSYGPDNNGVINLYADQLTDIEEAEFPLPRRVELHQNYPNPFNPSTVIAYDLPSIYRVSLKVYNILGQEVRTLVDEQKQAGSHRVIWDGKDARGRSMASGVYVYRLQTGGKTVSRKMLLIR